MGNQDKPPDIEAMRAVVEQMRAKERAERARWGAQGPPVNVVFHQKRLVAVFDRFWEIDPAETYHDFLRHYLQTVFEVDWWRAEAAKAKSERHPLLQWWLSTERHRRRTIQESGQVRKAPMPPETGHLLRLAYNLHQIQHQGHLQARLVKRLKHAREFQGVRYEVHVSAAFVRAGFHIELEPEGKSPDRVCEFVATHDKTGRRYSVEAKSRHRPGVLGRPLTEGASRDPEPRVKGLIRNALGKSAAHDRIICLDVNCPQPENTDPSTTWGSIIREQVNQLEQEHCSPAILICTNSPFHYLDPDENARGESSMIMGLNESRFKPQSQQNVEANFPGVIAVANAFNIPVPGTWD